VVNIYKHAFTFWHRPGIEPGTFPSIVGHSSHYFTPSLVCVICVYGYVSTFQSGTCTLREATIVSSVLAKNSVPLLHSAAAIIKIAEMDYNGANSICLRTLLDKKYALPYQAVDAVVYHFLRYVGHSMFGW